MSLTEAVDDDVTLNVTYAAGVTNPVTLADDLGNLSTTTVTIDQGDLSATVTVPIIDDDIVEGDETFTVTVQEDPVNGLPAGVTIRNGEATGTITDDDRGVVTLSPAMLSAAESGTFTYTVSLSAAADEAVNLTWTATTADGDTAMVDDDLQETTDTVSFAANDMEDKTFTIRPVADTENEPSETFTVSIEATSSLPAGVTIDPNKYSSAATITDDDEGSRVNIADATSVDEDAAGGAAAAFTVSLTEAVDSDVTLNVTYFEGPAGSTSRATPADDLGDMPSTVRIRRGTRRATLTVPIVDDEIVEGDETFTVSITENTVPAGVTIRDDEATGTIADNDEALVTLSPATLSVVESGTFTYTVKLSAAADEAVNLTWTATTADGDTAMVDDDLRATTGTVSFRANDKADKTFTIQPVDDLDFEPDETFTVSIEATDTLPAGVMIDENKNSSVATITNNDDEQKDGIVSIGDANAAEGAAVAFTVNLSEASANAVTVRWTATSEPGDGAATLSGAGSDLTANHVLTGTVVFAPDDTADKTVSLATLDDDLVEGPEFFTVTLSEDTQGGNPLPAGVNISTTADAGTGTITEDETAELSIATTATAAEGAAVEFAVSLSAASANAVTVRWTATSAGGDGAAELSGVDSDLTASHVLTGTVVFAVDDTADKTVSLATVDDDLVEGAETFTVTLSEDTLNFNPLPGGVSISPTAGAGTGTITEDEAAELSIATTATAAEGAAVEFAVSLSAASANAVTVRWTATSAGGDGAATLEGAGSDLTANHVLTGTLVFAPSDTADKTVSLATVDDDEVEGPETFTVTLSQDTEGGNLLPGGVSISPTAGAGTGTITEDESATIDIDDASVAENDGPAIFTVTLSAPAGRNLVLDVAYAPLSPNPVTLVDDLDPMRPTTVMIAEGETEATLNVPIVNDDDDEEDETFTVTLSENRAAPLPEGITIDRGTGTGTITNDDDFTVSIDPAQTSQAEGSPLNFNVRLSRAANEAVNVTWTATAGTGDGAATLSGAGSDLAANEDITGTAVFARPAATTAVAHRHRHP